LGVPAAVLATLAVGVIVTVTTETGSVEDPPPYPLSSATAASRQTPAIARPMIARRVDA
jgi:hypothetical protein